MRKLFIFAPLAAVCLLSCKDKTPEEQVAAEFKKADLHHDLAEYVITPGYQNLTDKMTRLQTDFQTAMQSKQLGDFNNLQDSWFEANKAFQGVKALDFGPAMSTGLKAALGTFPTDTTKILTNIGNADYNLSTADNTDAIGFAALEFLFFRTNAKERMEASASTQTYAEKLIEKMLEECKSVSDRWSADYSEEFISSIGTSSTSDFSEMVNEFTRDFELVKNAKLGIPMGKKTLGIPQPDQIEAPRAGKSMLLIKENLLAIQQIFNGNSANGDEYLGFDDYLIALDRSDLVEEINAELESILSDLESLPESLKEAMTSHPSELDALYVKIQDMVVHFKTDMTSAFGVLITYQDNDGD